MKKLLLAALVITSGSVLAAKQSINIDGTTWYKQHQTEASVTIEKDYNLQVELTASTPKLGTYMPRGTDVFIGFLRSGSLSQDYKAGNTAIMFGAPNGTIDDSGKVITMESLNGSGGKLVLDIEAPKNYALINKPNEKQAIWKNNSDLAANSSGDKFMFKTHESQNIEAGVYHIQASAWSTIE